MEVSVIVSTYNRKKRLKRAIDSILNQRFKERYEIIIVDDCSTDGTEEVVKEYQKDNKNIVYKKLDKNFGSDTRPKNEGCKLAKGKFIAYLDDDNEWLPGHLYILHKTLKENKSIDIVFGDRWAINEETGDEGVGYSREFNETVLFIRNFIDTSDVMHKKECIFEVGGWDESLPKFIDWNLWIRMLKYGYTFLKVPQILTNYYICKDMKSQRIESEMEFSMILDDWVYTPSFDVHGCKIHAGYISKPKKPRVAIFTLTMNRLDYTKRMIESMNMLADYDFDHYVVDNGSTDGTVKYLTELKKDSSIKDLILNKKNVGISKSSNQALKAIGDKYDYIAKVDNDCLFESNKWLSKIIDYFARTKKAIVSPYVEGLTDNPGGAPRKLTLVFAEHLFSVTEHIGGLCCVAPAELYKDFKWEEDDFLHGNQDMFFSQYAKGMGYTPTYLDNIRVYHMDSTDGQKKKYPKYFAKRKKEKSMKYKGKEKQ